MLMRDAEEDVRAMLDRERLAALADQLITGGDGLPSASQAEVHSIWIDRVLAARPDLVEVVASVAQGTGDPDTVRDRPNDANAQAFSDFSYAVAGAYLMNPRVRERLGLPSGAPLPQAALPDEVDCYFMDALLEPVLRRGSFYRPTP
jgi:hypothetical protein